MVDINYLRFENGEQVETAAIPYDQDKIIERLRKKYEFKPVTVTTSVGDVTITPIDKTLMRLFSIVRSGQGVTGWRADNGVFDLTNADADALLAAGQASVAKAFTVQATIEANTYDTIEDLEAAFDTAYNEA